MNGTNKLECYITRRRKGLQGTSTLAYWALAPVTGKRIDVNGAMVLPRVTLPRVYFARMTLPRVRGSTIAPL
jgi:hypothetical protein